MGTLTLPRGRGGMETQGGELKPRVAELDLTQRQEWNPRS